MNKLDNKLDEYFQSIHATPPYLNEARLQSKLEVKRINSLIIYTGIASLLCFVQSIYFTVVFIFPKLSIFLAPLFSNPHLVSCIIIYIAYSIVAFSISILTISLLHEHIIFNKMVVRSNIYKNYF